MPHRWILLLLMIVFVIAPTSEVFAENDAIYEKCIDQQTEPAPWCYQREVENANDPDLCENILKYWPTADGVHGQCLYQLALKNKDCSLCDRIKNADIRKMCILDVCKKK